MNKLKIMGILNTLILSAMAVNTGILKVLLPVHVKWSMKVRTSLMWAVIRHVRDIRRLRSRKRLPCETRIGRLKTALKYQ